VLSHKVHQNKLKHMMKDICAAKGISRHGRTEYSWRLPIFSTISRDGDENSPTVVETLSPSFCLLYQHEISLDSSILACQDSSHQEMDNNHQWNFFFMSLLSSHRRIIFNIPFHEDEANRLLGGQWLNDEIINAYLQLCGCLQSNIKILPTHWYTLLNSQRNNRQGKAVSWVGCRFFLLSASFGD
jgi:hypothetical protein